MRIDVTKLPNDPEALKALILGQIKTIDNLEFRVHQLDETLKKYGSSPESVYYPQSL